MQPEPQSPPISPLAAATVPDARPHRPGLGRLLVVLALLIIYVSLYPFRFRVDAPVVEPPWSQFDMVANVLLFLPFGLLARWLAGEGHAAGPATRNRLALLLLAGAGLAAVLQWLQLFIPGRLASIMDIGMNWIGLGLGAGLAPLFSPLRWQRFGLVWFDSRAGVLALCWLAAQLSPFLPGDPVLAWARQRYLFDNLLWQSTLLLSQALAWLILLRLFWPQCKPWAVLLVLAIASLPQPWLLGNVLRVEEMLAPLLAGLIFALGLRRPQWLLLLLLVFLCWRGLTPWTPIPMQRFHWLPFGGLVAAPMPFALATLAEKAFWYGCLYELGMRCGWAHRRWLPSCLLILLTLEIVQLWLPRHRAEITDPLLLILMVIVLRTLSAATTDRVAAIRH